MDIDQMAKQAGIEVIIDSLKSGCAADLSRAYQFEAGEMIEESQQRRAREAQPVAGLDLEGLERIALGLERYGITPCPEWARTLRTHVAMLRAGVQDCWGCEEGETCPHCTKAGVIVLALAAPGKGVENDA